MKQKSIIIILILLSISITFWTCSKDEISRSDDKAMCEHVQSNNFDEVISVMNNHLQRFRKNDDKALEKFASWLNSSSCVKEAKIICDSCMYSLPPQSDIKVVFMFNSHEIVVNLYVLMDEKLKVLRIIQCDE